MGKFLEWYEMKFFYFVAFVAFCVIVYLGVSGSMKAM